VDKNCALLEPSLERSDCVSCRKREAYDVELNVEAGNATLVSWAEH
jgi:hypothetical protein